MQKRRPIIRYPYYTVKEMRVPQGTSRLRDTLDRQLINYSRPLRKLLTHHVNGGSRSFGRHLIFLKPFNNQNYWGLPHCLNQMGFTLVELLIGIAIASILATIAVPNILSEMPKFRLNGATQQVLGDLMAARMRAVSQNKRVKVVFTDGNQYQICDDPFDTPCWKNPKIQDNFKGVSIDTGNDPIFQPRGTASAMTISIRNSYGCVKDLIINMAGRIRIYSPPCS